MVERVTGDDGVLSAPTVAQFRWLVAALRDEGHVQSRPDRLGFAARLEQALVGAERELAGRLGATLTAADAGLLVKLARWHEDMAASIEAGAEQTGHRGRARRYRDIAQVMRLWV